MYIKIAVKGRCCHQYVPTLSYSPGDRCKLGLRFIYVLLMNYNFTCETFPIKDYLCLGKLGLLLGMVLKVYGVGFLLIKLWYWEFAVKGVMKQLFCRKAIKTLRCQRGSIDAMVTERLVLQTINVSDSITFKTSSRNVFQLYLVLVHQIVLVNVFAFVVFSASYSTDDIHFIIVGQKLAMLAASLVAINARNQNYLL